MRKMKVGLVGCGTISDVYIENSRRFTNYEVVACADVIHGHAIEKAKKHGILRVCSVPELMNDPDVELVLNLTTPQSHAAIDLAALAAGKDVYSEKPLAVTLDDGKRIVAAASDHNLSVGCAPDTFLGGRLQTMRRLLDEGAIGQPVGGFAAMVCHGHESWHPNPEFYYKTGAGPMFDMAPYYVTALVGLLGPVKQVSGAARTSFSKRLITSEPLKGTLITVEVPTYVSATLEFDSGPIVAILMSFDVWDSFLPRFEIHGSEGTMTMADADPLAGPNIFGGDVMLRKADRADWNGFAAVLPRKSSRTEWKTVESAFPYTENSRGVGLADMVAARQFGREPRACSSLALHVLEIIHGILESANSGSRYLISSTCERPEPLPDKITEYTFTV